MKLRYFSFIAAASILAMASCTDDSPSNKGEENDPKPVVPEATTDSYTVYKSDLSRVHNYGQAASRSYADFTMPTVPTVPADALDLNYTDEWGNKPNLNYGSPAEGVYVIKAGDEVTSGLKLNGDTIYIEGTLNLSTLADGENENRSIFYVLPGGTLSFSSALTPHLDIYNWGELNFSQLTVGEGVKVYSATDIVCDNFGVNDGGEFYSKGTVVAENIRLNGKVRACAFIADKELTVNDGGTFYTSYFKAPLLTMNGGNVYIDKHGLIDVEKAVITNDQTRLYVADGGENAVFHAAKYITNNPDWPKATISPKFNVVFEEVFTGGNAYYDGTKIAINELELQGSKVYADPESAEAQKWGVPAKGCHPQWGAPEIPDDPTPDDPEPEPQGPTLEKVTDIDPLEPDHDHGNISATCIVASNDKLYASYHLRGQGQKGCIEVMEPNGNGGVALTSYMITPDYDFNHLIVDENKIIAVGNHAKKAAFIASLPVDFDKAEGVTEDLTVKELTTDEVLTEEGKEGEIKAGYKNAGDGNCVIRHGNYYYVTTYRGYGVINRDFSKVENTFVPTNGSSKHIDIENGKIAVLSHDTYDKNSSTATVNVYDANGSYFSTALDSYATDVISPVDGKNVIAIDGDNIYACLSQGGLVRLNDGASFHAGEQGRIPANGMAIDDKYIYAAMGSFVFVLDKTDLTEVTHYHASSLKSANYIALHNGLIYVAFGEDGIQVFRLNEVQ